MDAIQYDTLAVVVWAPMLSTNSKCWIKAVTKKRVCVGSKRECMPKTLVWNYCYALQRQPVNDTLTHCCNIQYGRRPDENAAACSV